MKKPQQVEQMVTVRNKTIIGLKWNILEDMVHTSMVRNKTIIGLKWK